MRSISILLPLLIVAAPARAQASQVVVFPLDARGVSKATAQSATQRVLATVRALPEVSVIEPATVEESLGVKLTDRARACEYDVFCLVEVGEILEGESVLIGHVRRRPIGEADEQERIELKLFVLDVAKAAVTEILVWRVSEVDVDALGQAVDAATRRLFSQPDAEIAFEVTPPNARITFYGEPITHPGSGTAPQWSGTYRVHAEAEGYHPLDLTFTVAPRGRTRLPISLEQDPLYVGTRPDPKLAQPFDKASRRLGSGVSAGVAGAEVEREARTPSYAKPIPWIVTGAGVTLSVLGGVLMSSAQSHYNALSAQPRYLAGVTDTADLAMTRRQEFRDDFKNGSFVLLSGLAVTVGGVLWMVLEEALAEDPPPVRISPPRSDRADPATQRAARALARDLVGGPR